MESAAIATIETHFGNVEDPRMVRKTDHPLLNILVITICGTLCGANDWVAMMNFGNAQFEWLSQFLDLKKGIPSHDTFGRVFALLDPEQFCEAFLSWMRAVAEVTGGELIALDGKQLRGSHDGVLEKGAIWMVSAWAESNSLVLGQRKVDEKSNEITAIPQLLEMLALRGCIVTIDAMGCQTDIAEQIVVQEADYVLSLKGNQGKLHEDVSEMFAYFEKIEFADIEHDYHRTVDKGHGRLEIRQCWSFDPHQWGDYFRTLSKWKGLQSVAMVRARRQIGEKVQEEVRFFISSLASDAQQLLWAVRRHWGIENELHWLLDVAFREDHSRVRQGFAAENLSVIRQLVLNLLKQEKTAKCGIENKRLRCGWDLDYRRQVLQRFSALC